MNPRKQIRSLASKSTRRSRKNRPDFASEEGITRRVEENRGRGTGATYKTWLRLKNPRGAAKLEIEKAYYESLEIPVPYRAKTEESLPSIVIENIKFVRDTLQAGAIDGYSQQLINDIDSLMRPLLAPGPWAHPAKRVINSSVWRPALRCGRCAT